WTWLKPGIDGASPSGSSHSTTSTVRGPRESVMSTVMPLGSGAGDQARNFSDPPRILTRTSPGPASPRVAMTRMPIMPITDSSRATSLPPLKCERRIDRLATAGGKATFRSAEQVKFPKPGRLVLSGRLQPAVPDAVDRVVGGGGAEFPRADLVQHHAGRADD